MTITGGKGPHPIAPGNGGESVPAWRGSRRGRTASSPATRRSSTAAAFPSRTARLTVIDSVISFNTAYVSTTPRTGILGRRGIRVTGCPSDLASWIPDRREYELRLWRWHSQHGNEQRRDIRSRQAGPEDVDVRRNAAEEAGGGGGVFYDGVVFTTSDTKVKNNVPNDVQNGPPARELAKQDPLS